MKGFEKSWLKGQAHSLTHIAQVGKDGLSDGTIKFINQALDSHELIKVKFLDFKDQKKELSKKIVDSTNSEQVGIIGNILILFRQNSDPEKRKIKLPSK
ncbi:MAG: YhbY family RNA-binding protein [Candidatus Marinimicrobia bacterium]|jgi:RNA-binding protein|nr:YhbY family RNA-binding protein [Candidatus Neomarinimicrobiota bacterium]MBT3633560.1 YhbY family RNA-binding protein [Candidatus Neomarinimicrobiota bacterium]MBT3682487.1 YhbY family RNA-binding protein [Candidatus Neomarinimicrobiota bacterium]MBT3759251.1 YhbY family RNA-binding protein [Candidatus Neomarinimicrobiota bacterium]MBT3895476.1 YhbY family RNA-binding protein [Candidatus Neomarinimicrobiota bacterium]